MYARRAGLDSPYVKTLFLFESGKQFAKLQKIFVMTAYLMIFCYSLL